jgi:class 3 adenylate cyclase
MSLVIVVAVAVLAFLLFRQNLRYDRSLRRMVEQSSAISLQSSAYTAIAEQSEEFVDAEGRLPPVVTETLTNMTNARRVSVWRLTAREYVLHCDDSFDRETKAHASGFQLHRREMPEFFEMLKTSEETEIPDATADPRSAVFCQTFMHSIDSQSLFVLPLHRGDRMIGMLCLEDAKALESAHTFVHTVAAMTALQMRNLEEPDSKRPAKAARSEEPARREESRILPADLGLPAIDPADLGAKLYSGVAVMVLRFSGRTTLAKKTEGSGSDVADTVAQALQAEASQQGVRYLKFVSQQVIAAAGLEDDAETAMAKIAALAIALRERCAALCEATGHSRDFRIGLDHGAAFGCGIGEEPRQFNMWGDAFETADAMANSAAPGAIQVSEAAYAELRQDFLLRPRGRFYISGVGEARTFVLAGQL